MNNAKRVTALIALFVLLLPLTSSSLVSCLGIHRNAEGQLEVDLNGLADDIQFYREAATMAAPRATPEVQAKMKELSAKVQEFEKALRAAAVGGPMADLKSYANGILNLANETIVMLENSGRNVGNAGFWVDVVRLGMLALERGMKIQEAREQMNTVAATEAAL